MTERDISKTIITYLLFVLFFLIGFAVCRIYDQSAIQTHELEHLERVQK